MSLTETPPKTPIHTKARLPADTEPKRPYITPKMRDALRKIVWEGLDIAPAAKAAKLKPISLRIALAKPHVKRFIQQERDVFIAHAQAQNIHHAVRIRECGNAAAEIKAVTVIEQIAAEQRSGGAAATVPGITIIIGNPDKPLQSNDKLIDGEAHELQISTLDAPHGPIRNGTD